VSIDAHHQRTLDDRFRDSHARCGIAGTGEDADPVARREYAREVRIGEVDRGKDQTRRDRRSAGAAPNDPSDEWGSGWHGNCRPPSDNCVLRARRSLRREGGADPHDPDIGGRERRPGRELARGDGDRDGRRRRRPQYPWGKRRGGRETARRDRDA